MRLGEAGERLALSWLDPLPAPVLAGDTATYPDVLPDVDLQLRAKPQGFSEVLVVKTRAAATRAELAAVRFGVQTDGVSIEVGDGGSLVAVDGDGEVRFQSPAPQMWDTPAGTAQPAATGGSPASTAGENQSVGSYELAGDELTVVPDQQLLNDPDVRFPLYIDPDFSVGRTGWTKVFSGKPGQSYWNGGPDDALAKVGRCDWPD